MSLSKKQLIEKLKKKAGVSEAPANATEGQPGKCPKCGEAMADGKCPKCGETEKACGDEEAKKKADEAAAAAKAEEDKKKKEEVDAAAKAEAEKKQKEGEAGSVTLESLSSKIDQLTENLNMAMEALASLLENGTVEQEAKGGEEDGSKKPEDEANSGDKQEDEMSEDEMEKELEKVTKELEELDEGATP